ncbi:MAG: aminoacyl-tRNA hydrolase [Candidatus Baltobacteraceae bacterium]
MVCGLGNPGKEYAMTRHNAGFMAVDRLAERLHIEQWKKKDGARQAYDAQRKVALVEPQTFMNNSGAPLRIVASWYRTQPGSLLVIYDEMDLPFGTIRMRPLGGHGGHNGMRSVIAAMTGDFARLRIGVGRPVRESIDHVLSPFTAPERRDLPAVLDAAAETAVRWIDSGPEAAMQFANTWTLEMPQNGR